MGLLSNNASDRIPRRGQFRQNGLMNREPGHPRPARDQREQEAAAWAAAMLNRDTVRLTPVSADASFRRYFRVNANGRSLIVMDAPPDREDSAPFVDIAGRLRDAGLRAPEIIRFDLEQGFGLIEDFGDTLYREIVSVASADDLFPELFGILARMAKQVEASGLPPYDAPFLRQELDLFSHWYLGVHRQRPLSQEESAVWESLCDRLIASAVSQPQVFVHRDFHSCNLLQTPAGPGIIDFQDGMKGPLSYDFISLIWDRYISWPRERIEQWMADVYPLLSAGGGLREWNRACDWMGLQRNLKVVGIFARLKYRDGKQGYLEMIPRFYRYLLDATRRYPDFQDFHQLLERPECAP
jgi:aminoglycoside/choline kinase family phosphotransferase